MSRFTVNQKAQRVLKFTMGLRSNKAYSVLAQHGFREDDLREGLELLSAAVHKRLAPKPVRNDGQALQQLDKFENFWFPIVRATLSRHYPEIGEQFMHGLGATSGMKVSITVSSLVQRLAQIEAGAAPYGPEGVQARALLAERGLTAEVVEQALALLNEVSAFAEAVPDSQAEEVRKAEEAMWQWYLEWSAIARQAITSRSVLRSLGFLQRSRNEESDQDADSALQLEADTNTSTASTATMPQLSAVN